MAHTIIHQTGVGVDVAAARQLLHDLVTLGSVADGGVAVPAHHGAPRAHDTLVHGRLHAVVLLDVQLGEGVVVEHGRLADVTEGGSVHDVPARSVRRGRKKGATTCKRPSES